MEQGFIVFDLKSGKLIGHSMNKGPTLQDVIKGKGELLIIGVSSLELRNDGEIDPAAIIPVPEEQEAIGPTLPLWKMIKNKPRIKTNPRSRGEK
jgi:hypothetical protein